MGVHNSCNSYISERLLSFAVDTPRKTAIFGLGGYALQRERYDRFVQKLSFFFFCICVSEWLVVWAVVSNLLGRDTTANCIECEMNDEGFRKFALCLMLTNVLWKFQNDLREQVLKTGGYWKTWEKSVGFVANEMNPQLHELESCSMCGESESTFQSWVKMNAKFHFDHEVFDFSVPSFYFYYPVNPIESVKLGVFRELSWAESFTGTQTTFERLTRFV